MKDIPLWQVKLTSNVAFFDQSVVEIITEPDLIHVPYCHPLANEMLIRGDEWVPVLRLHEQSKYALLLETPNNNEYPRIALTISDYPQKIMTDDSEFEADLAKIPTLFKSAAISAVQQQNTVIPILKPSELFNDRWLSNALQMVRKLTSVNTQSNQAHYARSNNA